MTSVTLQRGLAIALTLGLLLFVFEMVRRKRLSEQYAILWLLAALVLLALATWKGLLTAIASLAGIYYPPSVLFVAAIGLMIVLLLHFSLALTRLSDQNKVLAQRLGLLAQRLEAHESRSSTETDPNGRSDRAAAGGTDDPRRLSARPAAPATGRASVLSGVVTLDGQQLGEDVVAQGQGHQDHSDDRSEAAASDA